MHYSDFLNTLLEKRGLKTEKEKADFLNPSYEEHTYDPFLMKDMTKAVKRILSALEKNEKIAIYSDFDADGIPGGVLMYDFFKKIGYNNFINYIPHRNTEGYGFHKSAVEQFAKQGVSLIITVDVGISDLQTVHFAKELGIDCIITDHHNTNGALPNAIAVLNPKRKDCKYPFKELCGTAVAYKLVQALLLRARRNGGWKLNNKSANTSPQLHLPIDGWEKWLLDLVAIATVADMVPLMGENRVLTKWGLLVLRKSRRPGMRALCNKLKLKQPFVNEDDIGFNIAPRINAASRMDDPEDAFWLMAGESSEDALSKVEHLERLNNKRKGVVASMVRELSKSLQNETEENARNLIVRGNPKWNPSLLGLVAGSISDKFDKTVCLWGRDASGVIKGSCRSNGTVNIAAMLAGAEKFLLSFGGHDGAGGFSVSSENVHYLPSEFDKAYIKEKKGNAKKDLATEYDMCLNLDDISERLYKDIAKLAPFGLCNPKPIFKFPSVCIERFRRFGKDKNHIELIVEGVRSFTFFADENSFRTPIEEGKRVDLFATVEKSFWNGGKIELRIIEIM